MFPLGRVQRQVQRKGKENFILFPSIDAFRNAALGLVRTNAKFGGCRQEGCLGIVKGTFRFCKRIMEDLQSAGRNTRLFTPLRSELESETHNLSRAKEESPQVRCGPGNGICGGNAGGKGEVQIISAAGPSAVKESHRPHRVRDGLQSSCADGWTGPAGVPTLSEWLPPERAEKRR